jgi:hypothetical protein
MHVKSLFGALLAALFITSVIASSNLKKCWECQHGLDTCNKVSTALTTPTGLQG